MTQDNLDPTRENSGSVEELPRLRLKPVSAKTGYVDGAWWPRSDNLAVELPALPASVSGRLGPVRRITYRLGEWARARPAIWSSKGWPSVSKATATAPSI